MRWSVAPVLAAWLLLTPALPVTGAYAAETANTAAPSETEVANAVEKLKADPNLAAERTVRTLRWANSDKPPGKLPGWLDWLRELFGWIAQSGRVLVWLTIGVVVALLAMFITRFIREFGPRAPTAKFDVPTHVRDLDIRPESLPDDVGAAALALWERGEHRAALSLLYRGLLSRLAHVHALPIRHSTTEGDCIALAARHLPAERNVYVAALVRIWQRSVYGGHEPQTDAVQDLCAGFATALSPPPGATAA